MSLYTAIRNMGYSDTEAINIQSVFEKYMDVDKIANFIRYVDGNNTMGAGQLAEKIVEFITSSM